MSQVTQRRPATSISMRAGYIEVNDNRGRLEMTGFKLVASALLFACAIGAASAQTSKPTQIGWGVFTFTSGPAAAYGMPGRNAAELVISQINAPGGIGGGPGENNLVA